MADKAAATLSMRLGRENKPVSAGRLGALHGTNPLGESYGFTNRYMTRDGKPWIPVVGEFHYARFSFLHWEEELLKMKAGGVDIVSTYVFWNHHEEEEGVFDWSGSRNLRHFTDLCEKAGLPLILRVGPFCHGEVRNGGIPDWVFAKPVEIRSNDEGYLALVRKLYAEIARQVRGKFFHEGGPILAVQLENEFMHAGAPDDAWGYARKFLTAGKGGSAHLDELRRIAKACGFRPLFFTATAWGGAAVPAEETLPMLAAYAYTPWIPNQPPSREFLFRDLHAHPAEPVNYDPREYPVACCEMAGGMQVSYTARPYVPAGSVEAMTLVKLAGGSNLIGYYMYHGGTNPVGRRGCLNESGLPKMTYDYQAPLGEFGRVGESYHRIRMISLFLHAFGDVLAPMGTCLPEGQDALDPADAGAVRWCVRHRDGSGFVFLNNFQDHVEMPDKTVRIQLETSGGPVSFPLEGTLTLKSGTAAVLPFRLKLGEVELISATAQPLTRLQHGGEDIVVFAEVEGNAPELVFRADAVARVDAGQGTASKRGGLWGVQPLVGLRHPVAVTTVTDRNLRIIVLSREEALRAYVFDLWGEKRLAISSSHLYAAKDQLYCTSPGDNRIRVHLFPAPDEPVHASLGLADVRREGLFATITLEVPAYEPAVGVTQPFARSALLKIDTDWPEHVTDVFLEVAYDGDTAAAWLGSRMVTDHIHYGKPWLIGLKQIRHELEREALHLSITPLRRGDVHTFVNQAFQQFFKRFAPFAPSVPGAVARRLAGDARLLEVQVHHAVPQIRERPGDRMLFSAFPGAGQPVRFLHDQHFAFDDPVPIFRRPGAELKAVAHDGLEIVLHAFAGMDVGHPFGQLVRVRQGGP